MSENLPMCYEKKACYFCKKLDCNKRVQKIGYASKMIKMCDGNCYECKEAVRSSFYCKLHGIQGFSENFRGCLMYHYITERQNLEFYGRIGKISNYSKMELAILQLRKCRNCEDRKKYFNILSEISSKINEIPNCFESMTDLTETKALSVANACILEVLERDFECKTKIILKRIIKEYLASNESEKIDLDNLCKYIISNQKNIDYYIHPLTVKTVIDEI